MDGERIIASINGDRVVIANCHNSIYTEKSLPSDLVQDLRKAFNIPVVLDGEFISLEGDLYDFLSARAKMDDRLAIRVWDTLTLGLDQPLSRRRAYLEANMRQTERIQLVPQTVCHSKSEILNCFEKTTQEGYEGIVVKPNLGYYAQWLKLRPQHTQDLVILAIKKTEEWMRSGVPATFLMGYYDPSTQTFKRLGDVSSGLTLKEKKLIGEVASTTKTGEDKDYLYVQPAIVTEVAYYEKREKGLRFPKLQRLRFDKKPKDCFFLIWGDKKECRNRKGLRSRPPRRGSWTTA